MSKINIATFTLLSFLFISGNVHANWLKKTLDTVGDTAKSIPGVGKKDKQETKQAPVPANTSSANQPAALTARTAPSYLKNEPQTLVEEAGKLDIGINVFTYAPNTVLTATDEAQLRQASSGGQQVVFVDKAPKAIREVESYSLPVMLKDELLATSQFKSVSLRPGPTDVHDVVVDGEIRKSTGNNLILRMSAVDASGNKWFVYDYMVSPNQNDYADAPPDPYAGALVDFANTLLNTIKQKGAKVAKLERLGNMKYAASLAPEVFGEYLEKDAYGRTRLVGMPAADDPFWSYAMRCHEEESHILANDFGVFYSESQASVYQSYFAWRREYGASLEQYDLLLEERDQAVKAARNQYIREQAVKGGLAVLTGRKNESEILEDFLKTEAYLLLTESIQVGDNGEFYFNVDEGMGNRHPEVKKRYDAAHAKEQAAGQQHEYMIAQSKAFENHAEPINVELFDATVELEGSVDKQFARLRQKLVEVYQRETGNLSTASL